MKYIKDWRRILLDTTCLCSLFRSEISILKNSQDLFVRKVIEYLSSHKTSEGDDRIFLVSSITIAEMVTNEENSDKVRRIMKVLDSKNLEIVDFDVEVALAFNAQLKPRLNKEHLHKRAMEIGFETNDFALAREWITKDYMIAMCGIENNSDVILTADKNTFYPIILDVPNSNCVLTFPELFDVTDEYVLAYKEKEVANFITPKKETKKLDERKKEFTTEALKATSENV